MTLSKKNKENFIFANLLSNRFDVSTTDKIWSIDDTKLSFKDNEKKLSILTCFRAMTCYIQNMSSRFFYFKTSFL
jgi:hypothetical protein